MAALDLDGLLACAPDPWHEVPVGDKTVRIRAVSLMDVARLVRRFPAALDVLEGKRNIAEALVACGPEVVCALVAAGFGRIGDEAAEAAVARLPDEQVLALLAEILRITMPDGVESFFQKLAGALQSVGR